MPTIGELKIEISASTNRLRANLAQASSLIRDWSLLATGLSQGVTTAFQNIAAIGLRALTVSAAAMIGTFALAAKSGADFQDNITRAFVIMQESSGATKEDFRALTNEAIRLGSETLFSATDAAEGMQSLARAGFSVKQTLTAIGPTLNLAIAGNIGLKESTDITIASLAGFNLAADQAGKVSDILALASSQANTDVQLLGSALSFVAPVANSAGLSIQETAAAIGVLSNAGIRGSRAGTTLRRALSILLAPTGRAKKIFDELGLTFVTSRGKLESFTTIIRKLTSANLTAAQVQTVFGRIAGPGMAALLQTGSSALGQLESKLNNSEGAANRMAQAFRTTVTGRVRDLGASIVNLGLAFSQRFNKPLADTIFGIRNYIKEITEALGRSAVFKSIVMGIMSALSPLTDIIKSLAEQFKKFLLELTPADVLTFFDGLKRRVSDFIGFFTDTSNIKTFMNALVLIGDIIKFITDVTKFFKSLWDALPNIIKENLGAIILVSVGILALVGGLLNIIILFISIGAIVGGIITNVTFMGVVLTGWKAILIPILVLVGLIGAAIIGWKFGTFLDEIGFVELALAKIMSDFRVIISLSKLVGLGIEAAFNPTLFLDKSFQKRVATAKEEVGIRQGASDEIDAERKRRIAERQKDKEQGGLVPTAATGGILEIMQAALSTDELISAGKKASDTTTELFTNIEGVFKDATVIMRDTGNKLDGLNGQILIFRKELDTIKGQVSKVFTDSVDKTAPRVDME